MHPCFLHTLPPHSVKLFFSPAASLADTDRHRPLPAPDRRFAV